MGVLVAAVGGIVQVVGKPLLLPVLVVALAVIFSMADYVSVGNPLMHLSWSFHELSGPGSVAMSWPATWMALGTQMGWAFGVGAIGLGRNLRGQR